MSEVKRVALTTISTTTSNSGSTVTTNGPAAKEDGSRTMSSLFGEAATAAIEKKAKKKLTMRFELELFSPTDDKFPEFNYVHLVQMEKVSVWFGVFERDGRKGELQILLYRAKMHKFTDDGDTDAFETRLLFAFRSRLLNGLNLFVRLATSALYMVEVWMEAKLQRKSIFY